MAKFFTEITPKLETFIKAQHLFFVATAAKDGRVNLSPKGLADTFKIVNSTKIIWLNLTGSGNETAAHLLQDNRMTVMFCAFDAKPLILRLYGTATAHHQNDPFFKDNIHLFSKRVGTRQLIEMTIDSVQTSCGFAVPFMDFNAERLQLDTWSNSKGESGIASYWKAKNSKSIDGFETGISKA